MHRLPQARRRFQLRGQTRTPQVSPGSPGGVSLLFDLSRWTAVELGGRVESASRHRSATRTDQIRHTELPADSTILKCPPASTAAGPLCGVGFRARAARRCAASRYLSSQKSYRRGFSSRVLVSRGKMSAVRNRCFSALVVVYPPRVATTSIRQNTSMHVAFRVTEDWRFTIDRSIGRIPMIVDPDTDGHVG